MMRKLFAGILLGAGLVLLAGCGTSPAATTEAPVKTEAATEAPAAPAAAPAVETVDNCVDCHTNKQMLIDTAKPEEPVESESEGVG